MYLSNKELLKRMRELEDDCEKMLQAIMILAIKNDDAYIRGQVRGLLSNTQKLWCDMAWPDEK